MAHPPGLWDGMCHTCPYMTPHRWMLSGGFDGFGHQNLDPCVSLKPVYFPTQNRYHQIQRLKLC